MASQLEAAQAELDVAGIRRADIDLEMAKQQKILDDLAAQRKNKGRGRPSTTHASKVKDAESKIANLQRNILPTESAPYVPRTAIELIGSAAQHPQHHAAASSVPVGRPTSGSKRQRVDGEDDDDDDGELTDDDDGEESAEFKQYYGVAPAQQAFNGDVAQGYMKHELQRSLFCCGAGCEAGCEAEAGAGAGGGGARGAASRQQRCLTDWRRCKGRTSRSCQRAPGCSKGNGIFMSCMCVVLVS